MDDGAVLEFDGHRLVGAFHEESVGGLLASAQVKVTESKS